MAQKEKIENWIKDESFKIVYSDPKTIERATSQLLEIFKSEKEKNRQEIIKEILSKMEIEINGRDITIYELGDWLVKLKSQLKDEK